MKKTIFLSSLVFILMVCVIWKSGRIRRGISMVSLALSDGRHLNTKMASYHVLYNYLKLRLFPMFFSRQAPDNHNFVSLFGLELFYSKKNYNYAINIKNLFHEIFCEKIYYVPYIGDSPYIIDCGSNIGVSVFYFCLAYPNSKILAFEANPETAALLKKTISSNNLHSVNVVNKALSDNDGIVKFKSRCNGDPCASIEKYNKELFGDTGGNVLEVSSTKLSNYITDTVDILKIDIEGAEGSVILDLDKNDKLKHVRFITMEFHYNQYYNTNNRLSALLNILEKNNFSYIISSEDTMNVNSLYYRKNDPTLKRLNLLMIYAYNKNFDTES
jgi:FkbM family methyltransferase